MLKTTHEPEFRHRLEQRHGWVVRAVALLSVLSVSLYAWDVKRQLDRPLFEVDLVLARFLLERHDRYHHRPGRDLEAETRSLRRADELLASAQGVLERRPEREEDLRAAYRQRAAIHATLGDELRAEHFRALTR